MTAYNITWRPKLTATKGSGMAEIKLEDVAHDSVKTETVNEYDNATADPAEDVWDEERLEKAMDTLKEMYIQVRAPPYLDYSIH